MDVREKLVELLGNIYLPMMDSHNTIGEYNIPHKFKEKIADYLISNGVTVQEWIPVDDRLPKDDEVVIICTDKNFVYAGELIGDTWFLDNDSWTATVTHWMPTPQPPKGE